MFPAGGNRLHRAKHLRRDIEGLQLGAESGHDVRLAGKRIAEAPEKIGDAPQVPRKIRVKVNRITLHSRPAERRNGQWYYAGPDQPDCLIDPLLVAVRRGCPPLPDVDGGREFDPESTCGRPRNKAADGQAAAREIDGLARLRKPIRLD